MTTVISAILFTAAAVGLLLLIAQWVVLMSHVRGGPRARDYELPISILKPLCGLEDDLAGSIERFAHLDHPEYEVILGLDNAEEPAFPIACWACARWPGRFRLALRQGEPGLNPKMNQLLALATVARHDILVIPDSNVRVHADYLSEIAALLQDPSVGLVTHAVAGVGEERIGSALDSLHMTSSVSASVVAANKLFGREIVMGKSMAFRRRDLEALGGLEQLKDLPAEEALLGLMVSRGLGKRVAVARRPVEYVTCNRRVEDFVARSTRWHVIQRHATGNAAYAAQLLLNPFFLAVGGLLASPGLRTLFATAAVCVCKIALDGAAGHVLRSGGFRISTLALVPFKDMLIGAAWVYGLVVNRVNWRGNPLRILPATRIERVLLPAAPGQVAISALPSSAISVRAAAWPRAPALQRTGERRDVPSRRQEPIRRSQVRHRKVTPPALPAIAPN